MAGKHFNKDNGSDRLLYGVTDEVDMSDDGEQAEYQIIHALLTKNGQSDVERDEENARRIDRVMSQIIDDTPSILYPKGRVFSYFGIAASLCCISIMFFYFSLKSPTAIAEVNKIIEVMSQLSDRHYRIEVIGLEHGEYTNKQYDKKRRRAFRGGDLYLRNNNQYLLKQEVLRGRYKIMGNNSLESWTINKGGRVKLDPDPSVIKLPFTSRSSAIILTDIATSLEHFKEGYELTFLQGQSIEGHSGELSVIKASKLDSHQKGIKGVTIYYQPQDHLIKRIILHRVHMQGSKERKQVLMDLQSISALPDNWFDYQYHLSTPTGS